MNYTEIHKPLIEGCRRGERTAQVEIYKIYYKSMYNISLRILKNQADAEDVMQEAFLSAFKKIDSYKGEVSFGAWLKRIVVNQSIDMLRKKKAVFEELNTSRHVLYDDDDDDHSEEEILLEVNRIKEAIYDLPDGYRIILSLHLLEGYDHEEISEIMGISNGTSRSQLSRARQKLIELLKSKSFTYEKN